MSKKGSKENPISDTPDIIITGAQNKDGFLNYSYRINKGPKFGFEVSEKGKGIMSDDCLNAFNKFNVHLAMIDEVFKHQGVEVEDIDTLHNDENAMNYVVTGFKVTGDEGSENVVLKGSKYTALGTMEIETPKIAIDNLSSYKFYNELSAAVAEARRQTELYNGGAFEVPEKEEKPSAKQLTINDGMSDDEFKAAAL